ncbi:MAG: CBO0543 family protein [Ectobacillus sp.]
MNVGQLNKGFELISKGNQLYQKLWANEIVFSWRWFLAVFLTVFPWVLWLRYKDKKNAKRYFVSGLIIALTATFLDIAGLSFDLWRYNVQVVPALAGVFPWNATMLPVSFMFAYQWKKESNSMIKGIFVALAVTWIGEPFSDFLGLVNHLRWKHLYSLPIYYLLFVGSYYAGELLYKNSTTNRKGHGTPEEAGDLYKSLFDNSFDGVYCMEKQRFEKNFRFVEVNDAFCEALEYTREEIKQLNPQSISNMESYSPNAMYPPLATEGEIHVNTTFVTRTGKRKRARTYCRGFHTEERLKILCISRFL